MSRRLWTGLLVGLVAALGLLAVGVGAYHAGEHHAEPVATVGPGSGTATTPDGTVVRVVGYDRWRGGPPFGKELKRADDDGSGLRPSSPCPRKFGVSVPTVCNTARKPRYLRPMLFAYSSKKFGDSGFTLSSLTRLSGRCSRTTRCA